tara:strand:+ start:259 stop:399 length:141 start_codon:yes stop_codon:yes gene_type:complete
MPKAKHIRLACICFNNIDCLRLHAAPQTQKAHRYNRDNRDNRYEAS